MSGRKSTKKRTSLFGRLFWWLNLVFGFLLLGSYLAAYINPETGTYFAFLGLVYPYLLLVNILFFLFWLIKVRSRCLFSLAVILIGFNPLIRHLQVFPGQEAPLDSNLIKLVSFNVKNMANSNAGIEKADVRDSITSFINTQHADITCLQEYSAKGGDFIGVFGEVKDLTHYQNCYYSNYIPEKNYRIDALVILTNYPILDSGKLVLPGNSRVFGIYTDLLVSNDTIRLINIHLESIRFKSADYQFVEDVSKGQAEKESIKQGSISILRKLSTAYKIRSKQASVVVENLESSPYPVIICGDFNDTPLSYSYRKISSGLEDAFVRSGHGLGNTFAGDLPPLRIDYILYSPVFTSYDFRVPHVELSDHFPVSTFLRLNKDSEGL